MNYGRVVTAALAETRSKFALAEALALDIPPRGTGPTPDDEEAVSVHLAKAREAIIAAGGEDRSIQTLADYRKAALWVRGYVSPNFRWVKGVSFYAHVAAYKHGMPWEDFAAFEETQGKKPTVDGIRLHFGKASTIGSPGRLLQHLPPDEKAAAIREALEDEEVAEEVVSDPSASAQLSRARERVAEGREAQVTSREKAQHPTSWQTEHLYTATGHLGTACHHIKRALEALREVDLDDERREIVRSEVGELKDLLGWLESYVDDGGGSFDSELEAILKGGAS